MRSPADGHAERDGEPGTPHDAATDAASWISAVRLSEHLALGTIGRAQCVAVVRGIAERVASLHAAGGAHGAIHPDNVRIAEQRWDNGISLVATSPGDETYWSARRRRDGTASSADDVWALHALLMYAVRGSTGACPGSAAEGRRLARRTGDPHLRRVLVRYFSSESASAASLAAELRAWSPPVAGGRERHRRWLRAAIACMVVLAVVLAGAVARPEIVRLAGHVSPWRPAGGRIREVPGRRLAASFARASGSAVPWPAAAGAQRCLADWLLGDPDLTGEDLSFVCSSEDHRAIVAQVQRAIVRSARGRVTAVTDSWARLLWHQHAWVALAQWRCCRPIPRVSLPAPGPGCPDLGASLEAMARRAAAGEAPAQYLGLFDRAAACAWRTAAGNYPYRHSPLAGGHAVARTLLEGPRTRRDDRPGR